MNQNKQTYVTINVSQQLYTYLEDNKRYFDWTKAVQNFLSQKMQEISKVIPDYVHIPIYTLSNKTKTIRIDVPITAELYNQLERNKRVINWKGEIQRFLETREKQIEQLKKKEHGLDGPQDILIPKIPKSQNITFAKTVESIPKEVLKTGAEVTGIPLVTRQLTNSITDKERKRILKDLPEQRLGHFENNEMKDFFRRHNFYVTKFPTTPANEYRVACEIVYCYFKYVGGIQNGVKDAYYYQKELQKRTKLTTYKALMDIKNWNLEQIFDSPVIKYIFSMPQDRRIDVQLFDAQSMAQLGDLKDTKWNIKELYPFMDDKKYIINIYDTGMTWRIHVVTNSNDEIFIKLESVSYTNNIFDIVLNPNSKTFYKIDFRDYFNQDTDRGMLETNKNAVNFLKFLEYYKLRSLAFKSESSIKKETWNTVSRNISFLIFRFKKNEEIFSGIIFIRSGSEELMYAKILSPYFQILPIDSNILPENIIKDRINDAEFKTLIILNHILHLNVETSSYNTLFNNNNYLLQYLRNSKEINLNNYYNKTVNIFDFLELKLFTERNPCVFCNSFLRKFFKEMSESVFTNNFNFTIFSLVADKYGDPHDLTENIREEQERLFRDRINAINYANLNKANFYFYEFKRYHN